MQQLKRGAASSLPPSLPPSGNPNLVLSGGSMDLYPTDDAKKMIALWKKHGAAICDEFHKVLDSRPFTLIHGDLRADNLFRMGACGVRFICCSSTQTHRQTE
jgi:hypothetical protein